MGHDKMVQTDLWDSKVPTRNRFMQRTFGWDSSDVTSWPDDAWFINTTDKELKQYNNNSGLTKWYSEDSVIALTLALT